MKTTTNGRPGTTAGVPPSATEPATTASQATSELIGPYAKQVAAALGLSLSTVDKWRRRYERWHDSGIRGPVDRIDRMMDARMALDGNEDAALAPARMLAAKFHYRLVPEAQASKAPNVLAFLGEMGHEHGNAAAVIALAYEDGELQDHEVPIVRDAIRRMFRVAERATHTTGIAVV